jgi:L-ascorbate metabolism protein UlaG (beta-lactamase superfamily)
VSGCGVAQTFRHNESKRFKTPEALIVIKPALQDDAFLDDVKQPLSSDDEFRLWWLGQSGFLIQWFHPHPREGGVRHVLVDPYLSDSLTTKYAHTDKPHVRMSERVVDPRMLNFVDVISSSHNHTDHLDADTLQPLLNDGSLRQLVAPKANLEFVSRRLGIRSAQLIGADEGQLVGTYGPDIIPIASAHEGLDADDAGHHRYLGYIFELGFGPRIYHSGDTVLYDGMVERLRPFNIDVAILPINGRAPERRVAGNLWGREAAWLAKEIGAKLVIPCHYDMFEFNTATPDEFVVECQRLGQRYRVLKLGERWSSTELDHR